MNGEEFRHACSLFCRHGRVLTMLMIMLITVWADDHYITPTVRLRSCSGHTVILDIEDLQTDGMMFIRTDEVYNMQPTINGTAEYSCTFDNCKVIWGRLFQFVIQRRTVVQTKHDIHLTFMCIPDINPIISNDAASKNMGDINVTKFIYTAAAEMRFYYNNTELTTGSFIRLGTEVDMVIRITNNFEDFADINIKACTAATMYMFENRCPVDYELMGEFNKTGIGEVQNKFPMIRPTSTAAGPLDVLFSCTVEVCRTPCETYLCNGTEPATMETVRRKRQTSQKVLKSLLVGTVFRVGMEDILVVGEEITEECVEMHVYVIVMATLGFLILVSMVTLLFYYCEWKSVSKRDFKMSDIDSNNSIKSKGTAKTFEPKEESSHVNCKPSSRNTEIRNERTSSSPVTCNAPCDLQKSSCTYKGSFNDGQRVLTHKEGNGHHNGILNNSNDTNTQQESDVITKKRKSVQFNLENECKIDNGHHSSTSFEPCSDKDVFSQKENKLSALYETTEQGILKNSVENTETTPGKLTSVLKQSRYSNGIHGEDTKLPEMGESGNKSDDRVNIGQINLYHSNMANIHDEFPNIKADTNKATKGSLDLQESQSLEDFDHNVINTGNETLKVLTQFHNEDNTMESDGIHLEDPDYCQEDQMDHDHYDSDMQQGENVTSQKAIQKALAQEALQTAVGRLDPILQKFQSTLRAVRRRSSLQKTDSMKSLLTE